MSDPVRLIEGDSELERSLLGSWATRQPGDAARLRTLATVAGGAIVAGAGASIAPKTAVVTSSVFKWLGIAGGLVATAGAVAYVTQRDPQAPIVTPTATKASVVKSVPPTPVLPADPSLEAPPAAAIPAAPSVPPAAAQAVTSVGARPTRASSSLDEEVLAIDHARQSLAEGDNPSALEQAAAYDARYPAGALLQEAAEIRIEALFRSGKRAQAEKLAAKFLARNPASPYARVIRALASASTATPE